MDTPFPTAVLHRLFKGHTPTADRYDAVLDELAGHWASRPEIWLVSQEIGGVYVIPPSGIRFSSTGRHVWRRGAGSWSVTEHLPQSSEGTGYTVEQQANTDRVKRTFRLGNGADTSRTVPLHEVSALTLTYFDPVFYRSGRCVEGHGAIAADRLVLCWYTPREALLRDALKMKRMAEEVGNTNVYPAMPDAEILFQIFDRQSGILRTEGIVGVRDATPRSGSKTRYTAQPVEPRITA